MGFNNLIGMNIFNNRMFLIILAALVCFFFMTDPVMAGSDVMPWDAPMKKITASLTGPVALAISLLGITVAGGMLIFGGELGEFTRRVVMLVLVLGLLVSATALLTQLYGTAGLLI